MGINYSDFKEVEVFSSSRVLPESEVAMPKSWAWGQFSVREGQPVRYGWAAPENPKGRIAIFPGLFDFAEKYGETVNDLMKQGYAVAVVDWRGQGGSWRQYADRRHGDDIKLDVQDAIGFLDQLDQIPELKDLPSYALTHSLGSNIAIGVMAEKPDAFKGAVMNAPMMGLSMPKKKRASCIYS